MAGIPSFEERAQEGRTVSWRGGRYTKRDLMKMAPVPLRALFRERVHHTIEVYIYPIIRGRREVPPAFGLQAQLVHDVWKERGFSVDAAYEVESWTYRGHESSVCGIVRPLYQTVGGSYYLGLGI